MDPNYQRHLALLEHAGWGLRKCIQNMLLRHWPAEKILEIECCWLFPRRTHDPITNFQLCVKSWHHGIWNQFCTIWLVSTPTNIYKNHVIIRIIWGRMDKNTFFQLAIMFWSSNCSTCPWPDHGDPPLVRQPATQRWWLHSIAVFAGFIAYPQWTDTFNRCP